MRKNKIKFLWTFLCIMAIFMDSLVISADILSDEKPQEDQSTPSLELDVEQEDEIDESLGVAAKEERNLGAQEVNETMEEVGNPRLGENVFIAKTMLELQTYAYVPNAKIYFGNDIEWEITLSKYNRITLADGVTISGKDYYTGEIYTYTVNTGNYNDRSFQIDQHNTSVRFEDINFKAVGLYGLVYAGEYTNTQITFHNVNYSTNNGQTLYMPYNGKAIFSGNCKFVQTNGGSFAQSFGVLGHLEFAPNSNVTIEHDSVSTVHSTNAFISRGIPNYRDSTVTVGENANVLIKTTKDFIRSVTAIDTLALTINNGATLTLDQTKAVANTQFASDTMTITSSVQVSENASFNYQGNSAKPMLNLSNGGGLFVNRNATTTIDNAGNGAAISSNYGAGQVQITESKLTRFSSQRAYPMALTNNLGGNTIISKQLMEVSTNLQNYIQLGFVTSLIMNQRATGSTVISSLPDNWPSKGTYTALAPSVKSLVFKSATIKVPELVTNRDTTVTVRTDPYAQVYIRVFYENEGTFHVETKYADQDGVIVFNTQGKYLSAGSYFFAALMIGGTQVNQDMALVQDVTDVEVSTRRLEVQQDIDVETMTNIIKENILVTNGTMSYDINDIDSSKIGVQLLSITLLKFNQVVSVVEIPVFVYDDNCSVSPFNEQNPLQGTMVSAKDIEKRALDVTGNLQQIFKSDSAYQAWDERGKLVLEPSINIGDIQEIPLPGQYPIIFTVKGFSKTITLKVTSNNEMIDVSIPKETSFGTLATTKDQKIYSPEYKIINNSDVEVSVYVNKLVPVEVPNDFSLVREESEFNSTTNQAVLNLRSSNTTALIQGINPQMEEMHFIDLASKQVAKIHFDGRYDGSYDVLLRPKYKMVLCFEYKK